MQNIPLHLICCVWAPINLESIASKLLPSWRITWRWNSKGREQYDLNRETYEDVITLAVKHLGIRIRPKPDNAFAMLACAQCFGGNRREEMNWNIFGRRKKNLISRVCWSMQTDTRGAVSSWFDFADCHGICILQFVNECLLILASVVLERI